MSHTNSILFVILLILQIIDTYTTYIILSTHGKELNPVLAKVFHILGVLPTLILFKTVLLVILYRAATMGSMFSGPLFIAALIYVYVAAHNILQIKKLQK